MNEPDKPIRVVLQNPSLAKYRVPVYRELASREGIDLTVLYGDEQGITNVPPDGFRAELVPMREWRVLGQPLFWHSAYWQAVERGKADVAVLSWNVRFLSLMPALVRAWWNGIPTILWGHGHSKQEHAIKLGFRRSMMRWATAAMFYDSQAAQSMVASGFPKERVFVATNAIDQTPIQEQRERWLADPRRLAEFRREQQLDDVPLLLYVSRMLPNNRLDMLIESIVPLAERFPNIQVALIGGGDKVGESLRQLARQRGVERQVRFLGPIFEEKNLAPWFLSAKAFVYPCNIGLSLMHAFGYGLPAVTSDALEQQNPEIHALENGVNGMLYQDGNLAAMVDALEQLLSDDALRQRMGNAARQTVLTQYNVPAMVDGMEAAIRFCAASSSRGRRS